MATKLAHVSRPPLVFFLLLGLSLATATIPLARAQADVAVYEIDGLVADANGAGLQGAAVTLLKRANGQGVGEATTDASGSYRFPLVPAGDYVVSASHACCLRGSIEVSVAGTAIQTTAPGLQLEAKQPVEGGDPVKLTGVVKSTKGDAPVARVRIDISSYWSAGDDACTQTMCKPSGGGQYFSLETDASGRFEVEVNRGSAHVRAYRDGFDTTSGTLDMSSARDVSIPLQPTEDRTVRLHGTLQGDDGAAIGDGWVHVSPDYDSCQDADCVRPMPEPMTAGEGWTYESSQPQYNSTQTKSDGTWEIRVAAGRLRVVGAAEEHLEASKAVDAAAGGDIAVDLVLEAIPPDSVTVTGRVVDRATGKPVEGAQIGAENQKWGSWASAQTDADGRYELKTKPGYTILTARVDAHVACMAADDTVYEESSVAAPCRAAESGDEYLPAVAFFAVDAGASLTKDFQLLARPSAQSEFKGYVLNASSGKAIEGATVTFYNELTRDWGSATTDADGSYRIQVHAGYYSIRVWAPHFYDGVLNAEISEKESQRLDLELTPGEKRYGHWAYGGYAVMEDDSGGAPHAAQAGAESPPMPSDGQMVYEGAGGGLGPYRPAQPDGSAPSFGIVATLLLLGLWGARRRRE